MMTLRTVVRICSSTKSLPTYLYLPTKCKIRAIQTLNSTTRFFLLYPMLAASSPPFKFSKTVFFSVKFCETKFEVVLQKHVPLVVAIPRNQIFAPKLSSMQATIFVSGGSHPRGVKRGGCAWPLSPSSFSDFFFLTQNKLPPSWAPPLDLPLFFKCALQKST